MIMKGNLHKLSKEKHLGLRKNYYIQTKGLFDMQKGKRNQNEATIDEPKFDFTPKFLIAKNINTTTPTKIKAGRSFVEDENRHIVLGRFSSLGDLPAKSYLSSSHAFDNLKSTDRMRDSSAFDQAFSSFKRIRERSSIDAQVNDSDALLGAAYTRNSHYGGTGIFSSYNSRKNNEGSSKKCNSTLD